MKKLGIPKLPSQKKLTLSLAALALLSLIGYFSFNQFFTQPEIAVINNVQVGQIAFSPLAPIVSNTSAQTVQLFLGFNNQQLSGAEIELTYDSSKITIDKVEPAPYFSTIVSPVKISSGKVNFTFGVNPATYKQITPADSPLPTPHASGSNGGICPQVAGSCIGKDGTTCATYSNYCARATTCALPIQSCAAGATKSLPLQLATITYHAKSNPTDSAVQSLMSTTSSSKVSALNIDTNLLTETSSVTITLQSAHIAGDLNGDDIVNLFDFNLLVSKFNNPYTIFDFNSILANYGKTR